MKTRWMRMAVGAATAAVVVTALLAGVSAQQRIRQAVIFDMVRLSAVVTDSAGRYVSGLDARDFQVFEDGVEQQIQIFNAPDSPITFAVLVDGSVSIASRLPTVRLSVRELLRNLGARDFVQMVQFNERVSVLEDFSTRRDALEAAIDSFSAAGGTAVLNAVYRGLREIEARAREERDESRRRAIVLLSDGVDSSSLISEDVVLSEARRSRASVYSVGLGQNLSLRLTAGARGARGTALLEELGRTTGGRVIVPATSEDLQAAFVQVADELRHQYGLAYVSDNVRRDGRWRRIELRVRNRPDVSVRHREGYYAGS
jgi:Ca-activated chloride channel family protein